MSYLKVVIPIIVIVIIGGIIVFSSNQDVDVGKNNEEVEIQWRTSGPFSIEKYQYNLGEKIFLNVNYIPKDVKGEAIFFRPAATPDLENVKEFEGVPKEMIRTKAAYITIAFDGSGKENWNKYFEPRFNEWKGICSTDDLIGEWVLAFSGTDYEPIFFEILNQTSSWDDRTFEPLTNVGKC
ncbi:hypothetical protein OAI97_01010 [Nitrosopumilus sp.]|nr:hypothetical protein [Nitrosopumilus sp.]